MPLIGSNLEEIKELKREAKLTEKEINKIAILIVSKIVFPNKY